MCVFSCAFSPWLLKESALGTAGKSIPSIHAWDEKSRSSLLKAWDSHDIGIGLLG